MAKAEFKMPEDFMRKLTELGERTDEIVTEVLEAGGEVALDAVRGGLSAAVGHGTKEPSRSTGQLEAALGLSPARMDREGNFNIKVGFSEDRNDGVSNAMLANLIEYGKHGQPPKPFLKKAKASSRAPVMETMKRKLEDEIGKL